MGQRNDEFRRKYNELDHLCRAKYNMFRDGNGKRNNLSAIRVFSESLPEEQGERLRNIIKLRNIIEHTDAAEVNQNIIKQLNMFLAIIKGEYSLKQNVSFDVVSYIKHNSEKMKRALRNIDYDYDLNNSQIRQIENELTSQIDRLQNAKSMEEAKRIVGKFYNKLDNIDEHPIIKRKELLEAKRVAISEINSTLNESFNETINPFKRRKMKEIANRYIRLIEICSDEDEIDDYSSDACDAIEDVVY